MRAVRSSPKREGLRPNSSLAWISAAFGNPNICSIRLLISSRSDLASCQSA